MRASNSIFTAYRFDEGAFFQRCGKILAYYGMSDPAFSAYDYIGWYRKLAARFGGLEQVRDSARLFLIPGMNHCSGGQALDMFDPLTALVGWVENGTAPDAIVATGTAFPGRSRPLCAYPEIASYTGQGSTEDASNFRCVKANETEQ